MLYNWTKVSDYICISGDDGNFLGGPTNSFFFRKEEKYGLQGGVGGRYLKGQVTLARIRSHACARLYTHTYTSHCCHRWKVCLHSWVVCRGHLHGWLIGENEDPFIFHRDRSRTPGPRDKMTHNSVHGGVGLMALTTGLGNDSAQISSVTHWC